MADEISVSGLAAPAVIETLSFDVVFNDMKAVLKAEFPSIAATLDQETSIAGRVLRVFAYRELLLRARINEAAVSRLVDFARGTDLDWLAATYYADIGIVRMEGEDDDRLTRRILLAPGAAVAAITEDGIVYRALTADIRVIDAVAIKHGTNDIECIVLVDDGSDAGVRAEVLETVRRVLSSTAVKGMTMPVAIRHAVELAAPVSVLLKVKTEPDRALVEAAALSALASLGSAVRRRIGRVVPTDELIATARVGGVTKLELLAPTVDVNPGADGVPILSPISAPAVVAA